MDCSCLLGIIVILMLIHVIYGCSPEAWVEPTLKSKSRYAKIIAIGTVKRIIKPDPADMVGQTYGAKVMIQCSYKGGNLPGMITIVGAGRSLYSTLRELTYAFITTFAVVTMAIFR